MLMGLMLRGLSGSSGLAIKVNHPHASDGGKSPRSSMREKISANCWNAVRVVVRLTLLFSRSLGPGAVSLGFAEIAALSSAPESGGSSHCSQAAWL